MNLTTLRLCEAMQFDDVYLDKPGVTHLPVEGDKVNFRGSNAVVTRRLDYHTANGNLSIVLEVRRDWQDNPLLRYFI